MLIGITTTHHKDLKAERVAVEYLECVQAAGGTPLLLSPVSKSEQVDEIFSCLNGLLLTGGDDINPAFYGNAHISKKVENASLERDSFELTLARKAHRHDLPTFGICRGMQIMNVALGGTLYQDIQTVGLSSLDHDQQEPFTNHCHAVALEPKSKLASLAQKEQGKEYLVNSLHHQAVNALADNLTANAFSPEGIIEGIEDSDKEFFIGVQWHPEYLEHDAYLFESFCKAAQLRL